MKETDKLKTTECLPILEMKQISKAFPGVQALDHVDFDLLPGEVHVLVGENGAGKSTLAKIISGIQKQDSGRIIFDNKQIEIQNPRMAQKLGISMVFQEISLIPTLTVAQNLLLAHEPIRSKLFIDSSLMRKESEKYLTKVGLEIDPNILFSELGIAEQQLVALSRALSFNPKILILDETTSSLTSTETERLFKILRKFKADGGSVIYISHRLNEVFDISDRITVLKDGKLIKTGHVKDFTNNSLINLMVGQDLKVFKRSKVKPGKEVLRTRNLSSTRVFRDIDIVLHEGEIVGIAGLVGSGRTELAEAIFGARRFYKGEVLINGKVIKNFSPMSISANGLGFLTENRHDYGLCLGLSIQKNISMASLRKVFSSGYISSKKESILSEKYITQLRIVTPSKTKIVRLLSGGNQQKVVIAKWLCSQSKIFIFDEPTRGIDVKAKSEIHDLMDKLTKSGASILMISSELPEIISMSDRVYVMNEGNIGAELNENQVNDKTILGYMLGGINEV